MKFSTLTTTTALFFAMSLGLAQAQDGLPVPQQQQASVNEAGLADGQAQAFVEWAIENPERLQATLNEMGIQADLTQILAEIQAPGAAIAGSYRLRHYGEYGTMTHLEITPGLAVTRTRVSQKGKVLSKLSGVADLTKPNQIKIKFGPEEVKASGIIRKIARPLKSGFRGLRQGMNIRDAVYNFDGTGKVKGRFLSTHERGFRTDLIKPLAGTYKLYCADLVVTATERADRFNVERRGHDGKVRFGKAELKGTSKMRVKFTDGTRASYRFRIDNERVFGTFYPRNYRSNNRNSVTDGGWRDGKTPEPNWLERQVTKVSNAVKNLYAKVKAVTLELLARARTMIRNGWNRTKALAALGWNKTKDFAQASWNATKKAAKAGWDVTTQFVADVYGATKDLILDVIYFIRCNLAALVGAVETGAGKLKDIIAPTPRAASAE